MHFTELEEFLKNTAKENGIKSFCIAIHKDGKEIYKKSYSKNNGNVLDSNTRHWIYSMTKPITALMGVILLEKGIINLNDELAKFFPEYEFMYIKNGQGISKAKNKILIEHLFNMTAGFGYDVLCPSLKDIDSKATTEQVIRTFANEPLDFEPGTAFQYSFCFDVLAAVYEKATGEKISELYKKYIFDKLDMKSTGFDSKNNVVPMYYYTKTKQILPFGDINFYVLTDNFESGGAGLISTVDDYIKFADLLSNKGILPNGERLISESSAEYFYNHYLDEQTVNRLKPFVRQGYSYGFGCRSLVSKEFGALSPFGEFGWDGAAGSYVLMDTENNLSIVYMQDVLFWNDVYDVVHPKIRDLTYKTILKEDVI